MYSEAYKEWIALFKDDFIEIYKNERKELQRISLLSYAFQKELKNLRNNVEVETSNLKQLLKYKDDLERKSKSLSPQIGKKKSPSTVNKENNFEKQVGLTALKKNQTEAESPDLFKDIDLNAHCSSNDLSVIDLSISEDDVTSIDGSPTIKKRRKRYKFVPNPPAFNIISEIDEKPATPVNTKECKKTNLFKTPAAKLDHEVSLIDCTPEIGDINRKKSKTSSRIGDFLSKKKNRIRKSNNSTLTQLFRNYSTRTSHEKTDDGADSDETYFEGNASASKLGITELLDYINKDNSKTHVKDKSYNEDEGSPDMETSSQEVDEFSKGAIFNEEDIQTPSEKPRVIALEPEPVVRGKARQQLHGWSCQQCKDFYDQSNLSPEEIQKKMDECSRHRYKYHPRDETIPGFWDLSIPPEN